MKLPPISTLAGPAPGRLATVVVACAVAAGVAFAALDSREDDAPVEIVEFTVPAGASFAEVADTLAARGLVGNVGMFRLFARIRGDDRAVRSGRFQVATGTRWVPLLDHLVSGPLVTEPLTIPEGFTLAQIAGRIAAWTDTDSAEVAEFLRREDAHEEWEVPGPGLEGYLFPDTYRFAPGVGVRPIVAAMVERYRSVWTPERRARADSLGLSEREVVTLASIVQAEARRTSEMPSIAAVYHNRLRIGYLLQADPTVQYALGERRSRLLFADIDSVADHPYNTYTQRGLPPGPIGAPGEDAIEAALYPADVPYLYFVARPDGTHVFTNSLEAHNQAAAQARREWDEMERRARTGS